MGEQLTEGWGYPLNGRKFHYFRNGRSLCLGWFFVGRLQPDDTGKGTKDDCARCARLRQTECKRQAQPSAPAPLVTCGNCLRSLEHAAKEGAE